MLALKVTFEQVMNAMPLFATVFVLAFAAKLFFQKTTHYCIDEELTERDNPAFGVAFGGYITGVAIALSGALFPWEGVTLGMELLTIAMFGALAALLMRLSLWINDRAILHQFSVEKELVKDHNLGTGFVVAGSSIATGFMLRGVMAGFSDSVATGLRDTFIYFVVGQAVLIAGGWVYAKTASYGVHDEIEKDNCAAGISFGGYLAALGYIVSIALTGATSDWVDEIITALVIALVGIVLLVTARVIADYFLLPKSPLAREVAEDRNVAAGVMAATSFLLVAILFAGSLSPSRLGLPPLVPEVELESLDAPAPAEAEIPAEAAPGVAPEGGAQ
ncbi:MAG: DUF350 domain-containing protein [Bryobacterales bacterium]|nr:DUF350 domain-containing protein [Bryobacterales bacterium]